MRQSSLHGCCPEGFPEKKKSQVPPPSMSSRIIAAAEYLRLQLKIKGWNVRSAYAGLESGLHDSRGASGFVLARRAARDSRPGGAGSGRTGVAAVLPLELIPVRGAAERPAASRGSQLGGTTTLLPVTGSVGSPFAWWHIPGLAA